MNPAAADQTFARMFSLPNLIGGFHFSGIGFVAFVYGKRMERWKPRLIGLALMIYPLFAANLWLLYGVGLALSVALYVFRED